MNNPQDSSNEGREILKHIMATRYIMSVYDDEQMALLKDIGGKRVHWKEYDLLIDLLRRGKQVAKSLYLESDIDEILSRSQLVDTHYKKPGQTDSAYGECVYFVSFPKIRDHVKIGYTSQLGQRLRQFSYTLGEGHIILGIRTRRAKELESAIHTLLDDYRVTVKNVGTEFFEIAPVLDWIATVKKRFLED